MADAAQIAKLGLFVSADYMGTSMMRSLLPQLLVGSSASAVGSLESWYGLGQTLGSLSLPYLSDVLGRRRVLQLSCLGTSAGYGLSALAVASGEPGSLVLVGRVVAGLTKQTLTMARAMIGDMYGQESRQSSMALLTLFSCSGYLLGPLIGGWLADSAGVMAPLRCVSALFLLLFLLCRALPETAPALQREAPAGTSDWATLRQPGSWRVVAVVALQEFVLTGWTSVSRPRIIKKRLPGGFSSTARYDTWLILCVMLASGIWRTFPGIDTGHAMMVGIAFFALGLGMLCWSTDAGCLFASAAVIGVGISATRTLPATLLLKLAPDLKRGAVMGMLDLVGACCRVAAPLLTGRIIDNFDDTAGLALLVLALLLAATLLLTAQGSQSAWLSADKAKAS
ncbi:MFSD9 [Symbiodinium natans]|uniref:MFSD9 protein n=1 Tax=Symbiodinium natans TaxID=878477 RepID=A0A812RPJ8_9DINO|nr:MFSD9 [Symbiodinium natans]